GAADVAVERQLELVGPRARDSERRAQDGVRAQPGLVVGAVERKQLAVDETLVEALEPGDRVADLAVPVVDGAGHPFAAVAPVLDRPVRRSAPKPPDERINRTSSIPFLALHLVPVLVIFTGVTRTDLIVCAALYLGRMFFITAGYHRYFAHRSYKMARVPQFLMALGGSTAAQKGPLWWAAHHRDHHRYADTDRDIHS